MNQPVFSLHPKHQTEEQKKNMISKILSSFFSLDKYSLKSRTQNNNNNNKIQLNKLYINDRLKVMTNRTPKHKSSLSTVIN